MSDQADQLRELVRQRATVSAAEPAIVVLAGAQRGIGCTTVATELVVSLAELNFRTILVDADLHHGDASKRMLPDETRVMGLADVLAGRRTAAEVLRYGARGVRLLGHAGGETDQPPISQIARDRLADELRRLGERADAVVIDTIGGLTPWTERFWQMAREVIVVTTPDDSAVAATSAMLQVAYTAGVLASVRLVVNRCSSPQLVDEVHQHLGQAIFRYCGELLPALPAVPAIEASARFSRTGLALARAILAELEAGNGCDTTSSIASCGAAGMQFAR